MYYRKLILPFYVVSGVKLSNNINNRWQKIHSHLILPSFYGEISRKGEISCNIELKQAPIDGPAAVSHAQC